MYTENRRFWVKLFIIPIISVNVLVSLARLVGTTHGNMQGLGFKPRPPQKKNYTRK